MWRPLSALLCLPGLVATAALANPVPYHWSPTFYKAGIVADAASYSYTGFHLTCEPGQDGTRMRLVADGFDVAVEGGDHALDIDVDERRFRVLARARDDDPTALEALADPAIVSALTRGQSLSLRLPALGQSATYELDGAAPAIADMIADCAEFTPDWCAQRIVLLGQPALAGASAIHPEHRQAVAAALAGDTPDLTFEPDRSLDTACSAYYDLNNDGQVELLLYFRRAQSTRFGFFVFSGVNGDFRAVLQEEVHSPRFVVWSFVPARWGGWLDLVTQDVELSPATNPDTRTLIGHIFTWAEETQAYTVDWVNETPCRWPDCNP